MPERERWIRRPEVLLPATFLVAIALGTLLLTLPAASVHGTSFLQAFFTATSAVCVTGLVVVDTGTHFTAFGHGIILLLIQVGALGIMTFSVFGVILVGRRVGLKQDDALRESYAPVMGWPLPRLLKTIVGATFVIEAIGFLALWPSLGAGQALFHSVSAFCNAGFSLFNDSMGSQGAGVRVPVVVLLILGGLGFVTLLELARGVLPRADARRRFSLHARLVVVTSALLFLGGALVFTVLGVDFGESLFLSATTRTAGFEGVSIGSLGTPVLLFIILLMFVGASPGSTGGGIKTTTFALSFALIRTVLRGRERVTLFRREIPESLVRRVLAVLVASLIAIFGFILVLTLIEGKGAPFLALVFEVVSAFGTVGLSTGITPHLEGGSQVALCVAMFLGRVGILSLLLVWTQRPPPSQVRYPEERVIIG